MNRPIPVITKYGLDVVLKVTLAAIMVAGCMLVFVRNEFVKATVLAFVAVAVAVVVNFFRDPERTPPTASNILVAPADGKVVQIKEVFEEEYLKQTAVQLSIFMSPLDVHVNRFPLSGRIDYLKHIPGKYTAAYGDKSSDRNERTHIGIERDGYKVLFKQIAGAVARRIVADIEVGQQAVLGERFGMIKFGSRVDVIMPKQSVLKVKLHDRVVAGETVLATYM